MNGIFSNQIFMNHSGKTECLKAGLEMDLASRLKPNLTQSSVEPDPNDPTNY